MELPESFVEKISKEELALAKILCDLVDESLPESRMKLSYGVPYFYRKRRICFVWPAGLTKGALSSGVMLGFCEGYQMTDPFDVLEKGSRKQVYLLTFQSPEDINPGIIQPLLLEAYRIDQTY